MSQKISRRLFVGSALALGTALFLPGAARAEDIVRFNFLRKKGSDFPYKLTDAQWYARLGREGYAVLRGGENEQAGSSPLLRERRKGIYHCRGCDTPLFSSSAKLMANDWPTFRAPVNHKAIVTSADYGHILPRTEVHCAHCGSHLGYKFMTEEPSRETWRYPINGTALLFKPAA